MNTVDVEPIEDVVFDEVKVASPVEEIEVVRTACCMDDWMVVENNEDEFVEETDAGMPI